MEVMLGYKQTEVGVIPDDWESANVNGIASSVRNAIVGGPFGSDLVSDDYVDNGVPVIRGQNMGLRWVSGSFVFVTHGKANSLESNLARPGDLVFTQRGTLGQVSIVPDRPFDRYLVSQSQMKLTLNRKIADPLFYYYVFSSSDQQEFIRRNTIQTGVPHINLGILRNIRVQLPPLAEQEAIAEVLSKADAIIESYERLIAKKRLLKKGIMRELLTGKRRLRGFADATTDYNQTEVGVIPEDWEVKPLYTLADKIMVGIASAATHAYRDKGVVMFRNQNIKSGYLDDSDVLYIAPDYEAIFKNKRLKAGDLLTARTGYPGTTCVVPPQYEGAQSFTTLITRPNCRVVDPDYLCFYINSNQGQAYFERNQIGGGQKNVNAGSLEKLPVPLPSTKAEQESIAAILSAMDAEIALLEAQLAKYRQLKQGLMQKLLTGRIRLI